MSFPTPYPGATGACRWARRARRLLGPGASMLALTGCILSPAPPNEGQLGSDTFFYQCTEPSDAACDLQLDAKPLAKLPVIAVGATLGIVVTPLGHTVTTPTGTAPGTTKLIVNSAVTHGFIELPVQVTAQ